MTAVACEVRPAVDPSQFVTAVMMLAADEADPHGFGAFRFEREREDWLRAQPRPGRGIRCRLGSHEWSAPLDVRDGWRATYCTRHCGAHQDFIPRLGWSTCAGRGGDEPVGNRCLAGMHWMARVPGYVDQWRERLRYHDLREALAPTPVQP